MHLNAAIQSLSNAPERPAPREFAATPLSERLHGLDALRGFALLLGVVLHATMSYLPGAKFFWIVADGDPSVTLAVAFHTIHLFRMTLFFALAGFFARLAVERLGVRAFAKDRCKRIVLPLLLFWPLVMSGIVVALVWGATLANGGSMPSEQPPGPTFLPDDFPLTHLWFLYLLSLFYVAALVLRALLRNRASALLDRIGAALFGPMGVLLLALPVATVLALRPGWMPWFGIPTPDHSLYPNLPALVGYGVAFGAGWLLQRRRAMLDALQLRWAWNLALALGATFGMAAITGLAPDFTVASGRGVDLLHAALYGVASWAWSLALIGIALRHLAGFSAWRRYLADASYWMYIVHLPLVMLLQVALSRVAWPWFVEMPLLLCMALGAMLASYALCVRHTWLGALLNGRKVARRALAACVPAQ